MPAAADVRGRQSGQRPVPRGRARIVELAAAGSLTVSVARTFAFEGAAEAVAMLAGPHPSGKLALVRRA
jgi:hypothetical protein